MTDYNMDVWVERDNLKSLQIRKNFMKLAEYQRLSMFERFRVNADENRPSLLGDKKVKRITSSSEGWYLWVYENGCVGSPHQEKHIVK